jgi:putative integral membrane protein (TIGR02587 family)
MSRRRGTTHHRTIRQSVEEYGRGVAGGLLFSLPLLYTMEMWWLGFLVEPEALLAYVGLTLVLLLGYNRYAGMRRDASWAEVGIDSIEEMGIGLLLAAGVLYLLGRITADMPLAEVMGKIIVESMTVAVGISIGTAQLGGESKDTGASDAMHPGKKEDSKHPDPLAQLVLAFCGAVLFAANVAPTEEIVLISIETPTWKLLGLAALSFVIGTMILFHSGFVGSRHYVRSDGLLWIVGGGMMSYAAALLASSLMLWFFRGFEGVPLSVAAAQVVVLAFPATLGASAGRLLIQ